MTNQDKAPSPAICQRAWETAYVLGDDYRERLTQPQAKLCDRLFVRGPYGLRWLDICAVHILYAQIVAART